MRKGFLIKFPILILALCFILTIGGTLATWTYAQGRCPDVLAVLPLDVFPWSGSEALPEDDQVGKNHRNLIETILNGTIEENGSTTNLGLNYADSYLNNEIESRSEGSWWATSDTLGSMDFWESSDINKYFNSSNENITFVIYFPDGVSDTYYLYTTDLKLNNGNSPNIPIGENIYPIYQTVLQKNSEGIWEAVDTKVGFAPSDWYDNRITGSLLRYPSFDPERWQEGTLGTTLSNAVRAYSGQQSTISLETAETLTYYKLVPTSQTEYTVYSDNSAVKIRILDNNGNQIKVSSGAQDSNKVVWTAKANTTYYIQMSGAKTITFSIT